jgi:hypothetical protein
MTNVLALSDRELVILVGQLAARERMATAALIESLAELDRRQLHLGAGCSSLFAYCTRVLLLSEHAAYARIEAARATRRFPAILRMLADGSLTLTAVCLLAPHLTDTNHQRVLSTARHKSKREVEHIVAELRPAPDIQSTVRKLPVPAAASSALTGHDMFAASTSEPQRRSGANPAPIASPPPRPIVKPLAPERYRIQFTVGRGTYDKLQQATALMRHRIPNGDVARLFDHALTLLIADVERSKCGLSSSPRRARGGRHDTRHIPAAVRRAVWKRDGGQCAFVGTAGRCSERAFLEYHHVRPFADGGPSLAENLSLRCRAHNQYEADVWFGPGPLFVRECRALYAVDRARSGPRCQFGRIGV